VRPRGLPDKAREIETIQGLLLALAGHLTVVYLP